MHDVKEFWLDPSKEYTRNELREFLKNGGVNPWNSFIVHYKGAIYTIKEGCNNVENFICTLVPRQDEVFTKDSPCNIIPHLDKESSDLDRLKYGLDFKYRFTSEMDYDEFLYKNLYKFKSNYMLPEELFTYYIRMRHHIVFALYGTKHYDTEIMQLEKEIADDYKISLKEYEAENAMKKEMNTKPIPIINFIISMMVYFAGLIVFRKKFGSAELYWIVVIVEVFFMSLTVVLFPDCYCDDRNKINKHHACIYEIFTDVCVVITMIMIIMVYPQVFNIGGKFIMSLFG